MIFDLMLKVRAREYGEWCFLIIIFLLRYFGFKNQTSVFSVGGPLAQPCSIYLLFLAVCSSVDLHILLLISSSFGEFDLDELRSPRELLA